MGIYSYLSKIWQKPRKNMGQNYQSLLIKWRKDPATIRIERPTRIDRARSLGYKAKEGIIVVRQKLSRGGHTRPQIKAGRRSKNYSVRKNLKISYQVIAEQRAARKYPNMEVLNSYWVGEDSHYYWYEIILLDPVHPSVTNDKHLKWIADKQHANRVTRGLTSAAKKSRGLRNKGKGAEKLRPSIKARKRLGK